MLFISRMLIFDGKETYFYIYVEIKALKKQFVEKKHKFIIFNILLNITQEFQQKTNKENTIISKSCKLSWCDMVFFCFFYKAFSLVNILVVSVGLDLN